MADTKSKEQRARRAELSDSLQGLAQKRDHTYRLNSDALALETENKNLDLAIVSDHNEGVDIHVLADVAPRSNPRAFAHLSPVPDRGAFSYGRFGRHLGTRMNSACHGFSPSCPSVFETL